MAKIKAETLLRKIQKGGNTLIGNKQGVSAGGKAPPSFNFNSSGGISIFKKREIVRPYLHPLDSAMINDSVAQTVKSSLRNIDKDIDKNYENFLPKHLINDIYSLYYNPSTKLNFEGLDKTNKVKFDILDSVNNSLIKIVTNQSNIGSYVYAEEIGKFLYKRFMTLPPEQQEQLKKSLNNCNQPSGNPGGGGSNNGQGQGNGPQQPQQPKPKDPGKGKDPGQKKDKKDKDEEEDYEDQDDSHSSDSNGDEESNRNGDNSSRGGANNSHGQNSEKDMSEQAQEQMAKDLADMLNNKQSKKELEKAFEEAEKKLDKLNDLGYDIENDCNMPDEEKKEIIKNLPNLDSIRHSLNQLNVGKDKIKKAVEKILDGTSNYFSAKCITNDVELFEADQILDINGVELLHPAFRKSRIFDMDITERHYIGKFDLYIDCSGSMGGGCGGDLDRVCRIDLAKSLAMQMKEMGILGDLYEFEDRTKKISTTDMSILMMAARGGTNIEAVMQNILKSGNNSVVLTDGESHISTYTHKALFIGVGTDFYYFKQDKGAGGKLIAEDQCIVYNGKDFVDARQGIGTAEKARW